MDSSIKSVMHEASRASDEERITFPEVVMGLIAAGVERYHADLTRAEKAYYLPNGESEAVPNHALATSPAPEFSAEGVQAAVRAIQRGEIQYREFCRRIAAAGCVGYHVFITGKRAVYYGRTGDSYTEWFPGAK
jgi:uncharacterized protein YbcV (DUF1398 family)